MSDTTPQPLSRRAQRRAEKAQRKDEERAVRVGANRLKAAYAMAESNRRRIDPALREQIGRAGLTAAELQTLATAHVNAWFHPGRYAQHSQDLAADVRTTIGESRPAPRRNAFTRVNPMSRWNQNRRAGTKALKQAFAQAARDAKKQNPVVLARIGRSHFDSIQLGALASGRVGEVFRQAQAQQGQQGPGQQGPGQQGPGQQAQGQQGPAQVRPPQGQAQMIQPQNATRQGPAPQQVNPQIEALQQQVIALQQQIIQMQARELSLMQQTLQLQAPMQQTLHTQAQVQQQTGEQTQQAPEAEQNRQQAPALDDNVRVDNPVVPDQNAQSQAVGEGEVQTIGEAETAQQPAATRAEEWGASALGDNEFGGDEAEANTPEAATEEAAAETSQPATATSEQGAATSEPAAATSEPAAAPQQPAAQTGAQPAAQTGAQTGAQQSQGNGQPRVDTGQQRTDVGKSAAELDAGFAAQHAFAGTAQLNTVSADQINGAVNAGNDNNTRQRTGQQAKTADKPAKTER